MGVQEVRWGKRGTITEGDFIFFYGKGNENYQLEREFCVHHIIVSTVKRVEFVTHRMSYTGLRGRCCNITVLNVHATSEEKSDDSKDSSYKELEQVLITFLSTI